MAGSDGFYGGEQMLQLAVRLLTGENLLQFPQRWPRFRPLMKAALRDEGNLY
jgi:hypothetical protein